MSARYMLDTNICIYLRQNRPPEVTTRFRQMILEIHVSELCLSL
jgi:predicted nucleic acid-binding protein